MKYIIFFVLLSFIFFFSISCATVSAPSLIYKESAMMKIWISGKLFDIYQSEEERGRHWICQVNIDPVTKKIWTTSSGTNNMNNIMYLYDISGGLVGHEIALQFEENGNLGFNIFDNRIVLRYKQRGRYVIIDLITQGREEIQMDTINARGLLGFNETPIGFDGKSLVFSNGYYHIEDGSVYFFEKKLKHPRYQPDINIMIGINEEGYIVLHNIYSGEIEKTKIKRKRFSSTLMYGGLHLYYLDGRYLYFSKDLYNIAYIFATLPFIAPRKWYRYDLDTRRRVRINVPSNYIVILGSW